MTTLLRRLLALTLAWALCAPAPARAAPEKLTVMVYDRRNMDPSYGTCTDNRWTKYLQSLALSELGVELVFTGIDRSNDVQELTRLLASNNAPDVMFTYDYALWARLCETNQVADLTDAVAAYGDNLRAHLAGVLPYGQYRGRQLGVHCLRSSTDVTSGFIRKDWLDKLGITLRRTDSGALQATPEELHDVLSRFQAASPGGADAGAAMLRSYGTTYWPLLLIMEAFWRQEELTDEDRFALPFFLYPGAREGYRYLNRLYNEGLLNRDFAYFADDDRAEYIGAILSGQVGFWINDSWFGMRSNAVIPTLETINPDAEVVALDIVNENGRPAYKYMYPDSGMIVFVPAQSKHLNAAVRYMNLLATPEVDYTLRYGVEGEHYTLEYGIPVAIDESYNARTMVSSTDLSLMYNGCAYLEGNLAMRLDLSMLPEGCRALRLQSYDVGTANGFQVPQVTAYIPAVNQYSSALDTAERRLLVKTIMCAPDVFDLTWEECVDSYMRAGGTEVIQAKRDAYRRANLSETDYEEGNP